jgi:hypothetical protein
MKYKKTYLSETTESENKVIEKSEEKIINYESLKGTIFSVNLLCCFTVSILFLNLWVFPKKTNYT